MSRFARQLATIVGVSMLATAVAAVADELALADLFRELNRFEGRRVELAGQVTEIKTGTSRKGDRYYTLHLSDGVRTVMVLGRGRPRCAKGARALVAGTVQLIERAGHTRALIDAIDVKCGKPP